MSDTGPLIERLEDVLTALERIPRRFASIDSAAALSTLNRSSIFVKKIYPCCLKLYGK